MGDLVVHPRALLTRAFWLLEVPMPARSPGWPIHVGPAKCLELDLSEISASMSVRVTRLIDTIHDECLTEVA